MCISLPYMVSSKRKEGCVEQIEIINCELMHPDFAENLLNQDIIYMVIPSKPRKLKAS